MTKTTKNGIKVILNGNTITKQYSKNYITCLTFANHKLAKKEFSKFRQSHNTL